MQPFLVAIGLAMLLEACATPQAKTAGRAAPDGPASDFGTTPTSDLHNSQALSSRAVLPRVYSSRDATGRSARIDTLTNSDSSLPPSSANTGGTSPLVGTVPGGRSWP